MNKKKLIPLLLILIVAFTLSIIFFTQPWLKSINKATIEELQDVHKVGPIKAVSIYEYVQNNKINKVNQLYDYELDLPKVKGIGKETIKFLKRKYK